MWRSRGSRCGTFLKASSIAYLDAAGAAVTASVGAYQLERTGIHLFEKIEGDHFTILGLPLLPLLGRAAPRKGARRMSTDARACVMGHPVAHSRSPMLHGYWLRTLGIDGAYELADVAPEKFEDVLPRPASATVIAGGNITIPHKEAAFRLVDRRERAADAIGAVNTVWYEGDTLIGGNTDWLGIVASLDDIHPGWDASPGKARGRARRRRLGARLGALRSCERKFSVAIVNRTLERAEKLAAQFGPRVSAHGCDARAASCSPKPTC